MMSLVSRAPRTRASCRVLSLSLPALTGLAAVSGIADAQTIAGSYSADYSIGFNGTIAGITTPYGGLIFQQNNPNNLLLMGGANGGSGTLFSVPVTRGVGGHITNFGSPVLFATAPTNDGGLVYAPNGTLLYTRFSGNQIGEIKPGSGSTDKVVSLSPGVVSSVGTLQYVPSGFSNAGQLKIASYNGGGWYDATLTADGSGTYDITTSDTGVNSGHGPEGIIYVRAGNPDFSLNSILVSEYSAGGVFAYTADANGNPIVASRQDFITGLGGAEGGAIDPITGDFVFSTFNGGNKVVVVHGFTNQAAATPEPGSLALLVGAGLSGGVFAFRRRRNRIRK
ncbi:MAG: hypothetical protein JWN14_271 [Chthonomonadales bacterium]|nr:hypothetical protein [Chthonomonadales bacterium]